MQFFRLYRSSDRGTIGSRGWYAQEPDKFTSRSSDQWRAIFRGERQIIEPIPLKIGGGRQTNFISGAFKFLFDEKVFELLRAGNLSGWGTFPVKLIDKQGQELQGFHGLVVKGRSGSILNIDSKPGDGLRIDPNSWDGSDFFMPGEQNFQFCTKRVVEILAKEKITGVQWKPIEEA